MLTLFSLKIILLAPTHQYPQPSNTDQKRNDAAGIRRPTYREKHFIPLRKVHPTFFYICVPVIYVPSLSKQFYFILSVNAAFC